MITDNSHRFLVAVVVLSRQKSLLQRLALMNYNNGGDFLVRNTYQKEKWYCSFKMLF